MTIQEHPHDTQLTERARAVIERLTKVFPRTDDVEKQRLLVIIRLLEQAYVAGVNDERRLNEQDAAKKPVTSFDVMLATDPTGHIVAGVGNLPSEVEAPAGIHPVEYIETEEEAQINAAKRAAGW